MQNYTPIWLLHYFQVSQGLFFRKNEYVACLAEKKDRRGISLWSLLNWVLAQWCHVDLTGTRCFCLNKQACFFSVECQSLTPDRNRGGHLSAQTSPQTKQHMQPNNLCFFVTSEKHINLPFNVSCHYTLTIEIKVCQHLHSTIFKGAKTSYNYL